MKKRILATLLTCVLVCGFALAGCKGGITYTAFNGNGYSVEIDQTWSGEAISDGLYLYRSPSGTEGSPSISITEIQSDPIDYDSQVMFLQMRFENMPASGDSNSENRYSNVQQGTFGSNALVTADSEFYLDGALTIKSKEIMFFATPSLLVSIEYSVGVAGYSSHQADMEHVINSVKPL